MYQSIPTHIPTEESIRAREERYKTIHNRISWFICIVFFLFFSWMLYDSHVNFLKWRAEQEETYRILESIHQDNLDILPKTTNTLPPTYE